MVFSACAARLARDGFAGVGAVRLLTAGCAAASAALAALSVRAVADLARDPSVRPLPVRLSTAAHLQTLLGAAALAAGAQRAQMNGRTALMAFCSASAFWLLALGFRAMPSQWLSEVRLHDFLGRSVELAKLTWFQLRADRNMKTRLMLEAGAGNRVLFRARIAAPADGVRQALRRAGLSEGLPPGHFLTADRRGPARS